MARQLQHALKPQSIQILSNSLMIDYMTRITLLHAAPSSGNLGVAALGLSVISGLARRISNLQLTVSDYSLGVRPAKVSVDGKDFEYTLCGVRLSTRYYLSESLWNIRLASRLGGAWNPIAQRLMKQDFVLDINGGDSFTDLYGTYRFQSCVQAKTYFLNRGIPLGLLPQTYGPFNLPSHREIAVDLIRSSEFAWARDQRSHQVLQDLLGPNFDPSRHRCGVDVAFLLDVVKPPASALDQSILSLLSSDSKPLIGLNISGLIYNDPEAAVRQYGFVADYRQVIRGFIEKILQETDANVLLISHVVAPSGTVESDAQACQEVLRLLGDLPKGRVSMLPEMNDPRYVKWVVSQCDWFCGTRMHATIAGLSTGVPTAAIAYSLKTAGVFETCGQGDHVADPRELSTEVVIDRLWRSWVAREETRESLAVGLRPVLEQANRQMDEIAATCQGAVGSRLAGATTK